MYNADRALRQKQADSYEHPEGPPPPARISIASPIGLNWGFRGIPETDYWNRDESLYFDIPPELETGGANVNSAYAASNTRFKSGFAAASGTGTVLGTAVAGPAGGILGGIVGGLFKGSSTPAALAQNAGWYRAAQAGDRVALANLLAFSGRSPLPNQRGYARQAAKDDAWAKYNQLLASGMAPADPATADGIPRSGTYTLPPGPPATGADGSGGGIVGSPHQPGVTTVQAGMFGFDPKTLIIGGVVLFALSKVLNGKRRRYG